MAASRGLEEGIYYITNCLHHNNAALLNDNDREVIRGVSPENETTVRDTEKVRYNVKVNGLELTSSR